MIGKDLRDSSNKPFLNRAFLVSNPPGSIIKIITAAAGLEEKITTDSTVYCPRLYENRKQKF